MAIEIKPKFQIEIADDPAAEAAGMVTPSRYNEGSALTLAVQRLLGRFQVAAETEGEVQEIEILAGLVLTALGLGIDKASAANIRAAASNKVITADGIESASALVTLTDTATVAIDWDAFVVGDLVVTANRTVGNPTNVQPGVSRSIFVFGDSATERSLSWEANYADPLPEETVTSTSGLLITLTPRSTSLIAVSWQVVTP